MTGAAERAPGDPAAQLQAVVGDFAAWHARHRRTARVVQYELAALDPGAPRGGRPPCAGQIQARVRRDPRRRRPGRARSSSPTWAAPRWLCCRSRGRRALVRPEGPRSPDDIGALYADLALRMVTAG